MMTQTTFRTARQVLKVIPKKLANKPAVNMTRSNMERLSKLFFGEPVPPELFTRKGSLTKLGKTYMIRELQHKLGLKANATVKQVLLAYERYVKAARAAIEAKLKNFAKRVCTSSR